MGETLTESGWSESHDSRMLKMEVTFSDDTGLTLFKTF